jgi:hypothetical protein
MSCAEARRCWLQYLHMIGICQGIKVRVRETWSAAVKARGPNHAQAGLGERSVKEWASRIGLRRRNWNSGDSKDFVGQYRGHATLLSYVFLGIETSVFVPLTTIRIRLNCPTRGIVKPALNTSPGRRFSAKELDVNQSPLESTPQPPGRDLALQAQEMSLRLTTSIPSHASVLGDELTYNIDDLPPEFVPGVKLVPAAA